ncbi:MAG: M1 family metallopeptidase [Gemmatimonadales bacterium]
MACTPRRILAATWLLVGAAGPLVAQQPTVDVQAYQFRIDLPDTGSVIRGWASVLFETRRGFDDTLRLDLVGMTVDHVYDLHSMDRVPFTHDGRVLKIASRRDVMVEYHGAPSDGLIFSINARGRRSVFGDNWPNRARYWLPTVDHPSDKARVLWSIRAPSGWRVVANAPQCREGARSGPLCGESAPLPTYCMVLGATRMSVSAHRPAIIGRDTIPIEVWAYPEDSAFADSVPFTRATEIVETMGRIVGPFPYARLAHVQSSTRYGGMENATAIFYDEHAYVRRTMRESVVRHETSHQWFGDAVTERDWHDLWLSEGFASYFDLVIGAALDGDSVLVNGMRANAAGWMRSGVVNRPVIDTTEQDPNALLNANVYPKGAWVLHMLRGTVGDSAFFRGIREYYRLYRDSSVSTDQFQGVMERASGRRLGWFFSQWLRQPGYPQLDVAWRADSAAHAVTIEALQSQPGAWGRFAIPEVPVEFRRAGRVVGRGAFELLPQMNSQLVTFRVGEMPDEVVIDPERTLLMVAVVRH